MSDIDLSQYSGTEFNIIANFSGVFDGNGHTISNFTYDSNGVNYIGLFGYVWGAYAEIKDLGLIDPNVDARTGNRVGSLVGFIHGRTITNCYVEGGSVSGNSGVGAMVGGNGVGTITNCSATTSVSGYEYVGGLAGNNGLGTITNSYSTGSILGEQFVGGLVGYNIHHTITNCYSTGSVSGQISAGGLVGWNLEGTITNCYSIGSITGTTDVGGLVGRNSYGEVTASFWDIQTSDQTSSEGGTGKTTAEVQMQITFTDAGWDFVGETFNGIEDIWFIPQGDYPHLWWEFVPILHAEPEVTLGTSNTISWEAVVGDVEYYAECGEDANFTSIIYNSDWITETSCEFTGLQLGKRYWYSVKARNAASVETNWSNVESSLQGTLADAVDIMLDPNNLKSKNLKETLLNKINVALEMIDQGLYTNALNKLENDILQKTNGCGETGEPDKNDWIITCEEQGDIYPLVIETIEHVRSLMQ